MKKLHKLTVVLAVILVIHMSISSTAVGDSDDEVFSSEGKDNSVGVTRVHTRVVDPDPVPEVAPAPVVQGGEASVGEGVGDPLAEEFSKTVDDCLPETGLARVFCTSKAVDLMLMLLNRPQSAPEEPAAAVEAAGAGVPVVVTSSDVSKVMANGSGITRQPPGAKALVSKIVIVYTSGDSQTMETQVGGAPVTIVATPASYTWDWGDGTTTTTKDPGAAYPDHTVFHKYSHTADNVVISLTTTWTATYSVGGGPAQPISGTLTTTDTSDPFDLVRRISYLTDDAEEAQGH
mgnify:CR=1 FL=1